MKFYRCPLCDFKYKENKYAKQCEVWCKNHNSCNLEITKHSIQN